MTHVTRMAGDRQLALGTPAQYFLHFAGARATYVCAEALEASISADAWPALLRALGVFAP